jgi:hypothetical protein
MIMKLLERILLGTLITLNIIGMLLLVFLALCATWFVHWSVGVAISATILMILIPDVEYSRHDRKPYREF